jgi:hypothetical protein
MYLFGTGYLFVNPIGGNQAANPTPICVGTLQDINIDIDQKLKELFGSSAGADDVAPGNVSVTGKFTFGRFDPNLFAQAFCGIAPTTGVTQVQSESHSVPAVTPFTVQVANSATFKTDLGVTYESTGASLTKVTSVSAAGTYSVAAGTYTFDTADEGANVVISYSSTNTSGSTVTVTRQFKGYAPAFEIYAENPYPNGTAGNGIHIFSAKSGKLTLPLKQEDFTKAEIDFTAFYNNAGQLYEWYQLTA